MPAMASRFFDALRSVISPCFMPRATIQTLTG